MVPLYAERRTQRNLFSRPSARIPSRLLQDLVKRNMIVRPVEEVEVITGPDELESTISDEDIEDDELGDFIVYSPIFLHVMGESDGDDSNAQSSEKVNIP